ncbi:MAG: helix-turn-helix domain-containing protein [Microthrixaceae bacterium]
MDVGRLLTNTKGSSGRSVRGWAADARVAGSTITRIQTGTVDPTVRTLERLLDAVGYKLELGVVRRGSDPGPRLGDLVDAWSSRGGRLRLDWTRWRRLLDQFALQPDLIPEAIYVPPSPTGNRVVDALLAAVAEKLADDAHLRRPSWTGAAPLLDEPFQPPVRGDVAVDVPSQLAARGLMIDTGSLWRDRQTVGV